MQRVLRFSAWTLGSVVALALVLCFAVLIAGNTSPGRTLIERAIARLSGGRVQVTGLLGSFPEAIEMGRLQLSDDRGIWLTAEHITLRWSPTALLARHVQVKSLKVAILDIERRPQTEPSSKSSSNSIPQIDVQRLVIASLVLGPALAGSRTSLALQGTGHLQSLEDVAGTLHARRTDGPGGEYDLSLRFDTQRMDADLRVEEPAGGVLENLLQYPGLGGLSVQAKLSGPRGAEQVSLHAKAGELRADAVGLMDLRHQSADMTFSAAAPSMTPRPGLAWRRIALQGRWLGSIKALSADAQLSIESLEIPSGAGLGSLQATLHASGGTLTAQATAAGLVVPGPAPQLLADSPLHIEAHMSLEAPERPVQINAAHRLVALEARAVTAGEPSIDFRLRLPDLAPLTRMAHVRLWGRSELRGTVDWKSAGTRIQASVDSKLGSETALPGALLAGTSHAQLVATLSDDALEIERLSLTGARFGLTASGTAERSARGAAAFESVRARYELRMADLSVLSGALRGTATLTGQVSGALDSLSTRAQLFSSLSVRGAPRESITASLRAGGLPKLSNATVSMNGTLVGAPLQLDASLERRNDSAYHLTIQRAKWKSAEAEGELTTGAQLRPGHGQLQLRVEQLADLQPLVGTRLQGGASGDMILKPAPQGTNVDVRLDAEHVEAAGIVAETHVRANGTSEALTVRISAKAPYLGGSPGALEAMAKVNLTAREVAISRLEALYHQQTLRLLSPARLDLANGLALHSVRLGLEQALFELDGRLTPQLELHAAVHRVDARLVNAFMPALLAQGRFEADAQLAGTLSAPTGTVKVLASEVRFQSAGASDLHALSVDTSAHLQGDSAQVQVHVNAGPGSQLVVAGAVPLSGQGILRLTLTGKLDAALFNPLLEARGERAAGTLTVDASVAGSPQAPEVSGALDLAKGDLCDYIQGIHIGDITAHLTGSQGAIKIVSLTGRAAPGQVSVTGTLGVLQPQMPVDLHLVASNAQPIASDILTAMLDADLNAKGTLLERIDVSGSLNVKRAVIGIPNALPPEVAVLDVRRPGQAPPAPAEHKLVVGLDVQLHAPREVRVQGRGLNAELGGDLRVRGTADSPRVSGGFDLIRGTFALASTHLNFTKGRVSFAGTGLKKEIDPTLDLTAEASTTDATVTLRITGFADAPQFTLESSPSLPQDEILARLLFGVSASQLTALQVAQIGAALASLSGVGGSGPNPLARVQKALGLDRLSVGSGPPTATGESSGTSVEAGRYVSERVFVGLKHSTTGFSQVEADVDLTKHLKLQTRLGNGTGTATTQGTTPENDPGNSIGLMYQFEY